MILFLASCGAKKSTVRTKTTQHDVIDYGKKYLNTPYRYAGKGPRAFDCSGYTSFVFKNFGYKLNSTSAGQARQGIAIKSKGDLDIADLVFFEGRSRNGRVGHVGIVSEIHKNGRFSFIHASTTNGVIISSSEEPYYKLRYLRGGRIIENRKAKQKDPKKEESVIAEREYIKTQEHIIYKETDDGFVATNTTTGKPLEGDLSVSPIQESKPIKSKENKSKSEDKKKENSEFRQTAIRGSEETVVAPPSRTIHNVKPGETLYSIAKKYNCSIDQLKKWNPDIKNNDIRAGDKLVVFK